ncbi:sugar transferase [Ornithinimicrobium cavernae]|uniref:sugar transferase n=1 Tax=Ornithinimicrobium cavernae TaxID=2666047 RepID=UPI00192A2D24|nr:sugar transferase [Ornithinimicrobium cavernae]
MDLVLGGTALVVAAPVMAAGVAAATWSTRQWGIFAQERVGRNGVPFQVYKVRSMCAVAGVESTITVGADPRITPTGRWLRRLKIDELPQLLNVVRGDMSLVGPRPDVVGWADRLEGRDRVVLTVRPGITGPASVAFRHEEDLLDSVDNPEAYNREVIWPKKVGLNRHYVETWTLRRDFYWLATTVRSLLDRN